MNNKDDNLYLTKEGLEQLKKELKELKDIKRPEIIQKIKEAREMGDISENSMYDSAREEQAFMEGKMAELEDLVKNAQVIKSPPKGEIGVGSKVTVHIDGGEEVFHIVGAPEADPVKQRISHESPLGQSLVGKKVGEKIDVEAPVGKLTYTILKID